MKIDFYSLNMPIVIRWISCAICSSKLVARNVNKMPNNKHERITKKSIYIYTYRIKNIIIWILFIFWIESNCYEFVGIIIAKCTDQMWIFCCIWILIWICFRFIYLDHRTFSYATWICICAWNNNKGLLIYATSIQ